MGKSPSRPALLVIWLVSHLLSCSAEASLGPDQDLRWRAANLGGWLVTEGWIKPSLSDGIPNNDLLDGTQVTLRSVKLKKYLSAETGGETIIVANRTEASGWETFRLWRIADGAFYFRVFKGQFFSVYERAGNRVLASWNTSNPWEIVRNANNKNKIRIRAPNGLFLQVRTEELVTADFEAHTIWEDDDTSVFVMGVSTLMRGEFQITNGYGRQRAAEILREHWNTFVTEDDFRFMKTNGLNAVRIPIGWWIAHDSEPPKPYVSGSLKALDNAFIWAQKYNMKVIIDLHAAPGSQNGQEHSGGRDETVNWGTPQTINETVAAIDFIAARYGKNPSLLAVGLLNEPRAPDVTLKTLEIYYSAGYAAVRKRAATVYVIMGSRVGSDNPNEIINFADGLYKVAVDVHYYSLFSPVFDNLTVQENLKFIKTNRSTELKQLTRANGPLVFVGEWVAEWQVKNATMADYVRFVNAQIEVYRSAIFGWAYWTLKNVNNHWSLQWMIKHKYLSLK